MGHLTELDQVFERLLLDSGFRRRYRSGAGDTAVSAAVRQALSSMDWGEFERLARRVRHNVGTGAIGGIAITKAFQRTLGTLAETPEEQEAVIDRFLASGHVAQVNAVGNSEGVTVAEAFYRFMMDDSRSMATRLAAQHEFCAAVLHILGATERVGFIVESGLIRRHDNGAVAVLDANRPLEDADQEPEHCLAIGVTRNGYWSGAVTKPTAAALLLRAHSSPSWAVRVAEDHRGDIDLIEEEIRRRKLM
ncbi:hypothetical protein ABZ806_04070 [Spirillospora sp. NPDC047418]|jgi:hypothetical protein